MDVSNTHMTRAESESPIERTPSPQSSEDLNDVKIVTQERPQRQQEIIDTQLKPLTNQLGKLKFYNVIDKQKIATQIELVKKNGPEAAKMIDQIELAFGKIPLDHDTQKLLFEATNQHPELSKILSSFLSTHTATANDSIRDLSKHMTEENSDLIGQLSSLMMEIGETRHLSNTQFNTDHFVDAAQLRREKGIQDFENILSSPKDYTPSIYRNMNDPVVIMVQQKNIEAAQNFARLQGFGNTNWWPATLSGRSMLFCADWDNPEKTSRHIGIMLGNRVRMLHITSDFKNCETQIQQMHQELMSNQPPDKANITGRP